MLIIFFFSSRRRHTRLQGDWSSDVCSSDLKLEEDYDPTDKISALRRLHETSRRGEFATGLIYIEPDRDDFLTQLNVVDEPLATLPLDRIRPGREALEEIMEGLR